MKLEDMQVIWDSQNERTMYQFDEQVVLETIQNRSRSIASYVSCFEIAMLVVSLFLSLMLLMEPIIDQKEYYQIPQAILAIGIAAYIWRLRAHRQKTELQFDQNVLGMLDRSIFQLRYKIRLSRTFPWWFLLPMLVGVTFTMPFVYGSKPIWLWPMVFVGLFGSYIPIHRKIQNGLRPVKSELESVRKKFADASESM